MFWSPIMVEKKNKVVYVLCPANAQTGGADALHQMVYYLNNLNICAKIVYRVDKDYDKPVEIPDRFKVYVQDFLLEKDIVDSQDNAVVITESYTKDRLKYRNAKVYIWWLGINDNITCGFLKKILFFTFLPLRVIMHWSLYKEHFFTIVRNVINMEIYPFRRENAQITHLCASFNAYEYVSRRSHNTIFKCIEPISKRFLNTYHQEKKNISKNNRENVILFNPLRKYDDILNLISEKAPELCFEPLRGLTQEELIEKYKTSKLYIDFGAFPGAERIPKEAVLFGCAIITGKRGASGFHGDVPIPDEYKFGDPVSQIDEIVAKIRYVLDNYENVYSDFDEYRETVLNLEDNFIKSLKETFG